MRDGLRSRDCSDELENIIPLSCLVPKKKKKKGGDSTRGGSSSGKNKGKESKKKKKRLHLIGSDDTISDTEVLSSVQKKLKRNGCISDSIAEKKSVGSVKGKRKSEVEKRSSSLEQVKCSGNKFEPEENESKRSRLDVFEYNEDDLVDYKTFKDELESKHRRVVDDEEKTPSKIVKKKSLLVKRNNGSDVSVKLNCEKEDDKSIPSASNSEEKSKVSRQNRTGKGEDGYAVVLVDKKKVEKSEKNFGHSETEANTGTRFSGGKRTRSSVQSKDSIENLQSPTMTEKKILPKGSSAKKNKSHNIRRAEKDASLQQDSDCLDPCISEKGESNKREASLTSELRLSTEFPEKMNRKMVKQLIRDQIRSMVESAGWKIDYRPRKSRESYNDAVYIDHDGVVYWSILRAYHGLQKQNENNESSKKHQGTSFSFTPIPKVLLNQLKRRTKKKIAMEKMVKRRAEKGNKKPKTKPETKSAARLHVKKIAGSRLSREKLSSLIRQDGKSLKMRMKKNGARRPTSTHDSDIVGNGIKPLKSFKASLASSACSLQGRKSKTQRGYTLLVRKSDKEINSDCDDFMAYTRKRTVLSWLIDSEIVSIGGKVKYMNKKRTRALLEGTITSDGINCGCCSKIVTISEFQTHAGRKFYQPCQNIFVGSGVTLFQCLIDAWNKQEESKRSGYHHIDISADDPNDDACGICGDGGDLICCDGCPSTFHQSCLGIQVLPKGDWHCFNCCCKFCGLIDCSNGQGDEATTTDLHTCSLCEEKYHRSCILQKPTVPVDCDALCGSFCGQKCKELFEKLQKLLGIKHELEAGFSWTLIRRSDLESETSICRYPQKVECNSKLTIAVSVMNECFLPTIDERSGINLIQNVVYNCGSNFNRLNYSGFYTFLLERGDEIISVASIRIRRARFAEMPFIGTRHIYRRQGMCRMLLNAIESALSSLHMEKLIIPAISELMDTWTRIFGFSPFEESYKNELRSLNLVVFPGVALLQKLLMKQNSVTLNDGLGSKAIEVERDNCLTAEATDSSDTGSVLPDTVASDLTVVNHTNVIINNVVVSKTDLQAPGGFIQNTSDVSNHSDATGELLTHVSKEEVVCSNSQSRHESVFETNSILLEMEKNPTIPTMNISVELNLHTSIDGGFDGADKKLDTKIDVTDSGLQSNAKTSSLRRIDLNEGLELQALERGNGFYKFQPQEESSTFVTKTTSLLPEVEKETSKKMHVNYNAHDSIEDAGNDGKSVNITSEGVQKAPHSSVEISAHCTRDVPDECHDMHCPKVDTEFHISQSQDEYPLIELENESAKYSHAESNDRVSAENVANNVQEVNMIIEDVEANAHTSVDISDQCTTDVYNQCSGMHSTKEDFQSWGKSSVFASRLESLWPVVENKPTMKSFTEPNLQVSTEDAVDDAQEVNIQNDGIEPNLQTVAESPPQCETDGVDASLSTVGGAVCIGSDSRINSDSSYQIIGGMESKLLEASLAKVREPRWEEITTNASDEAIKHGNVETAVACENGVDAILDHSIGTITKPQPAYFMPNHQGRGENITGLKTVIKGNSKAILEIHDVQSLQHTETECNVSNMIGSFCEVGNKVVTDSRHKSTDCDSVSCIPKAVDESVSVKCNFIASVKCKGHDFPPNTCNSSSEAVVHHASEPAHKNTHNLADEPLVAFSSCTSVLQDSANGNVIATNEEVPLGHRSHVPQVPPRDSHDAATEPVLQISNGPGCTSLLLRKDPGSQCDTDENITKTDEVDLDKTDAAASDEIYVHGTTEVR